MWPLRITNYAPSHRQFRLDENLTSEEITEAVGAEPEVRTDDGKVTLQWKFWAEATFPRPDARHLSTSICCKIWDYDGARWSAYGWPEAFEAIGLTPLFTKDYGTWQYDEDGNETLSLIAAGIRATCRQQSPSDCHQPDLTTAECPNSPTKQHQVDTSMEEGPHHCFNCGIDMRGKAQ